MLRTILIVLSLSTLSNNVGMLVTSFTIPMSSPNHRATSNLYSTLRQDSTSRNGVSRFGVRKRVRDVLERAKERTGVSNVNSGLSETTIASSVKPFPTDSTGSATYATTNTRRRSTASISASFSLNGYDYMTEQLNPVALPETTISKKNERSLSSTPKPLKLVASSDAANAAVEPLPFTLPELTKEEEAILANGQRVEQQATMSREGSGYVVMDIPAPDYVVWEALLDFEAYPDNIGTVRSMRMFTNQHLKQSYISEKPIPPGRETRHYGTGSITRAQFVLSKFHLSIAAIHKYVPHPDGHYMEFTLDKACKNMVLKDAKGIWYTQQVTNDVTGQTCTRLWLLCELHVSPLLPQFIVDYAARKAMPRATVWIMPTVERLRKEFKLDERTSFLA